MTDITALQSPPSLFRTHYSVAIRIWHWITFITFTATISLVLLASTVFTMRKNTPMVQEQVQKKGGVVSADQARAVAHEYSDKLWMLHKYIGYGLCFLLLCRIVIEIIYSKDQRLAGKIRKALSFQSQNGRQHSDRRHYLFVKWGYVIFYGLFLLMALSGLGLAYEEVPFVRSNRDLFEGTHKIVQFLIYFYILAHLVGVIRADLTDNNGIVSSMINGGQRDTNSL